MTIHLRDLSLIVCTSLSHSFTLLHNIPQNGYGIYFNNCTLVVDIRSCLVCTHHKTITMYTLHCIHMGNVFLGKYLDLELTSKRIYILNFDKQYEIFLWKRLYQSMSVPTVYRSLHYLISLILLLLLPPYFPNL